MTTNPPQTNWNQTCPWTYLVLQNITLSVTLADGVWYQHSHNAILHWNFQKYLVKHWLSLSGNNELMHCGILIDMSYSDLSDWGCKISLGSIIFVFFYLERWWHLSICLHQILLLLSSAALIDYYILVTMGGIKIFSSRLHMHLTELMARLCVSQIDERIACLKVISGFNLLIITICLILSLLGQHWRTGGRGCSLAIHIGWIDKT